MENKFLSKFDSVKTKFNKKIKDTIFIKEIDTFKKYNIIDENNMFNYIYIHNYYQNLIENPFVYKINIISKNREQIASFISLLLHEENIKFELTKKLLYQTYLKSNNDKKSQKVFDLYMAKPEEKNKNIIQQNKSFKEIIDFINNENNNNEYLITSGEYKFNSYPSLLFQIFTGENYETDIIPMINKDLNKDYLEKNKNFILFQKGILTKYFNDKNTLYLNEQIYHRATSLLSTLNIFLYNESEWEQNKTSLIEKIKVKEEEKYKDILINNIIYNIDKNILYYIDQKKEKDLFNSNTIHDEENNFNLLENIYKITYTHFKTEMNYVKTYLLNYNSLINDHMKITHTEDAQIIKNEEMAENFKNNIVSLIKTEEEEYFKERKQLFDEVESLPKDNLLQNISRIKQEIDSKYFITNNTFNHLQTEISKYLSQYQSEVLSYMTQLDNLNINFFYRLKKILNEQGIYSRNFDGLIKIITVKKISIQDPIQNLLQQNNNTFAQILKGFGLSGIVGGTASFLTGRAVTTVGASAATGTFGGPLGIGVGVVLGVSTLVASARHHFKGNRGTINALFEEVNNNIIQMINNVDDSVKKEIEKIIESMENDIKEIKNFIDILVDRVIKILTE